MNDLAATPASLLPLLGSLYDASTDVTRWKEFLRGFSAMFGGFAAQVFFYDPRDRTIDFTVFHGLPEDKLALFAELIHDDPRTPMNITKPWHPGVVRKWHPDADDSWADSIDWTNCVYADRMVCSFDYLQQTPIYQRLLGPLGIRGFAAILHVTDAGQYFVCAVLRSFEAPEFTPNDLDLLRHIRPHFFRAIHLHQTFSQLSLSRQSTLAVLDRMGHGAAVLSDDGVVVLINRRGRQICSAHDGLAYISKRLYITDLRTRQKFEELLRECTRKTDSRLTAGQYRSLNIPRTSGRPGYSTLISPLSAHDQTASDRATPEPLIVVFFSDPDAQAQSRASQLRDLYGLTAGEVRVLMSLLEGESVKTMSASLKISENAVRQHIKNLFSKTGTHRQSDLIRTVMSSPEWAMVPRFSEP